MRTISMLFKILAATGLFLGTTGGSIATAEEAETAPAVETSMVETPVVETSVVETSPNDTASSPAERTPENTLDNCRDGADNDDDGHVDCDDQDCEIFAICVKPGPSPQGVVPMPPSATTPSPIRRSFSIGFVPGLSTNGWGETPVINHFSLNFVGMGDLLYGAELSMLGAIRRHEVRGYQSASLFNINLDSMIGHQVAGVMNFNRGDFAGFQAAGLTVITLGDVSGFQASGKMNLSGALRGFQGAGVGNIALGDMRGFQGAGVFNAAIGEAKGFQGAGVANVSLGSMGFQGAGVGNIALGDMSGFQGAGVFNSTHGTARGFQGAGVANVNVGDAAGFQAAGVANVTTGRFTGGQFGLINIGAEVTGAQFGLINIATKEMKGASVGLINYAGDGIFAPTFWISDSAMLNLGLKMGSRYVYSILGAGGHPLDSKRFSAVAGLGGHIPLPKDFWLEIDLLHYALHSSNRDWGDGTVDFIEQGRVNLGYRFAKQFSLYAGPSCNVLVSNDRREVGLIPPLYTRTHDDANVAVSIGLTAGIQWEPQFGKVNSQRSAED